MNFQIILSIAIPLSGLVIFCWDAWFFVVLLLYSSHFIKTSCPIYRPKFMNIFLCKILNNQKRWNDNLGKSLNMWQLFHGCLMSSKIWKNWNFTKSHRENPISSIFLQFQSVSGLLWCRSLKIRKFLALGKQKGNQLKLHLLIFRRNSKKLVKMQIGMGYIQSWCILASPCGAKSQQTMRSSPRIEEPASTLFLRPSLQRQGRRNRGWGGQGGDCPSPLPKFWWNS